MILNNIHNLTPVSYWSTQKAIANILKYIYHFINSH